MTFLSGLKRLGKIGGKAGTKVAKAAEPVADVATKGAKNAGGAVWTGGKKVGKVVVKHPVKSALLTGLGAAGVYALVNGKRYDEALMNLSWELIKGIFGLDDNFLEEVRGPFFAGILVSGGMKYVYKEKVGMLLCIAAAGGVEFFLQDHDFDDLDNSAVGKTSLSPFHVVFAVVPAAAGGYVGYKAVQLMLA